MRQGRTAQARRSSMSGFCAWSSSSVLAEFSARLLITAVAENGTVFFCDSGDDAHMRAVLRRTHMDRYLLSGFQNESVPAGAAKDTRRPAFHRPFDFFAL